MLLLPGPKLEYGLDMEGDSIVVFTSQAALCVTGLVTSDSFHLSSSFVHGQSYLLGYELWTRRPCVTITTLEPGVRETSGNPSKKWKGIYTNRVS